MLKFLLKPKRQVQAHGPFTTSLGIIWEPLPTQLLRICKSRMGAGADLQICTSGFEHYLHILRSMGMPLFRMSYNNTIGGAYWGGGVGNNTFDLSAYTRDDLLSGKLKLIPYILNYGK